MPAKDFLNTATSKLGVKRQDPPLFNDWLLSCEIEGESAFFKKTPMSKNPYHPDSASSDYWRRGWVNAFRIICLKPPSEEGKNGQTETTQTC